MDWFVREETRLGDSGRTGGMHGEKGGSFFRSPICAWLRSMLVSGTEGIAVIRYEGAQDVDLMLADGRQIHVR